MGSVSAALLWQLYYLTNIIYVISQIVISNFISYIQDPVSQIKNMLKEQTCSKEQNITYNNNIMSKTHHISYINLIYKRSYNLIYKKSYNLIYKNLIYKSHIQKSLYKVSYNYITIQAPIQRSTPNKFLLNYP